jgi:hypothetical protein
VTRVLNIPELRFVVPGTGVSFRSPKAKAYKRRVRSAARACLGARLLSEPVEIRLDYFHSADRRFDMDNIAKCVLDALNGFAYVDDRLARVQSATAHDLRRQVMLPGGPVDLVKPLRTHNNYLFVRLRSELRA